MLPSAQAGGAERVLLNLLRSFDRRIFDLHLIIIDARGPYLNLVPSDVVLHRLGYNRVGKAMVRLAAVLRNLKPDAVLSSIGHLNLALLLIEPLVQKKMRLFIRESNIASVAFARGIKNRLFRWLYRILYQRADGIICPGEAIKSDLSENFGIKAERMIIIPNPVYVDEIRSRMNSGSLPLQRGGIRLLAAGSLTRQKGFDLLIKAIAELKKIKPEIHLTILGDGPEKRRLDSQIRSLGLSGFVALAGVQENPFAYFHCADLFILSSRWEGLPNVVLESLACGTPVVAFDCPGCIREILSEPSLGVLVPAEDVDALASAILARMESVQNTDKSSLLPERYHAARVTRYYESILSA